MNETTSEARRGSPRVLVVGAVALVCVVVAAGAYVFVVVPQLQRSKIAANERMAETTIELLADAQMMHRAAKGPDVDGDGDREYGNLEQLCSWDGRFSALAKSLEGNAGRFATESGYAYILYFPDGGHGWIDGSAPQPDTPEAVNLRERQFLLYAWPLEGGKSGYKTFARDEEGTTLESSGDPPYDGLRRIPAANAAHPEGSDHVLAPGAISGDRNRWGAVGQLSTPWLSGPR